MPQEGQTAGAGRAWQLQCGTPRLGPTELVLCQAVQSLAVKSPATGSSSSGLSWQAPEPPIAAGQLQAQNVGLSAAGLGSGCTEHAGRLHPRFGRQ